MISVIVPTHNEEKLLPSCLESVVTQQGKYQLIVSDGASTDNTLQTARRYTNLVVTLNRPDLAGQLNAGAAAASGNKLLFLHADSFLSPGCISRLERLPANFVGGSFTMQVEGRRFFYRLFSLGGNLYCRLSGTHFGDRGIFVRTGVFKELGGFARLPIMTDVDFSQRLKSKGKTALLKGPVISSSRKFEKESAWRSLYLIFYALIAFKLNVDPLIIKEKYYSKK